ncbi:class III chitinase [Aspergillus rambellii]|uniref:chitinase n=3 Tax=Aspergillus subgen. Nidulantes TaxID=2720870 RepID=A0A0F8UM66_9EURO|nr:class III chitinase [Aspergillus rambellii]KKK14514.1 class III chitinase [Aspergillus ochraceoroseus]
MGFFKKAFGLAAGLAMLSIAYAKLDLNSNSTVAVYWGQNSFRGSGDLAQQRLSYYCNDSNIDVLILAFVMRVNGMGGAPEVDFSTASEKCDTFPGTNLKNCPEIGADITTCQQKGKTIILSIGGATYSEGGFQSQSAAEAGADLIWATFGPNTNSSAHRPFGDAAVNGFDFDFEAGVSNMAPFASRLRTLGDAGPNKPFFLTAAPQCPYPDAADKDILNGPVSVDAVWVQFYNNYCGVNAYVAGQQQQNNFNFEQWDNWAKTVSQNKQAKVYLGVAANTGAASTGYLPIAQLDPVIAFSQQFSSFGGVMMWDVTQAYGNSGFLDGLHQALGKTPTQHAQLQQESQQQTNQHQHQQPQDQDQDEDEDEDEQEQPHQHRPLIPSIFDLDDDLDWIGI